MKYPNRQQFLDSALTALLLGVTALFIHTAIELARSRDRENEMFLLANRLDVAAFKHEAEAQQWRAGALSCFGRLRDYRAIFDDTRTMMPDPPLALATEPPTP